MDRRSLMCEEEVANEPASQGLVPIAYAITRTTGTDYRNNLSARMRAAAGAGGEPGHKSALGWRLHK